MRIGRATNFKNFRRLLPPILGGANLHPPFFNFGPGGIALKLPQGVLLLLLKLRVQGVTQLRSGRRDQDSAKERPPTPISLHKWREGLSCLRCDHSPNSAACECRWSRTCFQTARCNVSAACTSATRSVTADTQHSVSLVGAPTSPVADLPRGNILSAVAEGETT